MFFWPCIMNWLYINHQLLCTDYYLFIKYSSPLHVSSLKCSSSGGYSCIHAAYGTVTLYESSWWPVDMQLKWRVFVAWCIQHVKRMNHWTILAFVVWPALHYFSTLSHRRHDFRKKNAIEHESCLFFIYILFRNIPHSKKNWLRYDQKRVLVFI